MPPIPFLPPRGQKLRQTLAALWIGLSLAFLPAGAALAEKGLPKPHVSPALDAVLLPITAEVRKEFKLGKKAAGVVVVSVDPGGIGELYGFEPGEVITELDDKIIRRPVDIDSIIRYKLNAGTNFFFFEGTWKNRKQKTIVELSNDDYVKPVAVDSISKWRAYNVGGGRGLRGSGYRGDDGYYYAGGGFYYYDFCDSYYDDFYQVYDYTLIYVEQVIVTEVYITSIESTETVFYYDDAAAGYDWTYDDYYISEVDEYVYSDEFYAEYDSTEVYYEDEAYDPETGLSYEEAQEYGYLEATPEGYDETATDEGYVDDSSGYDEAATDEGYVDDGSGYDEAATDEGYVDDGSGYADPAAEEYTEEPAYEEAYEEPAYEETYEEPAYEEPVYEEPAYEEPAYEEPAYEEPAYEEPVYEEPAYEDTGGGGDCYVDENGYEVCG